jgi:hypothetical protein
VLRRLVGRRSDNPNDAVNGTYGGQGKAVAVDPPAALLSELPKQQKRRFVLAVTGSGVGVA